MDKIITLTIVGIVLFGAEIFVPGGILGFLGLCAIGAAVVITWLDYGTTYGLIALAAALALSLVGLAIELYILRHTRFGRRFFLDSQIKSNSHLSAPAPKQISGIRAKPKPGMAGGSMRVPV